MPNTFAPTLSEVNPADLDALAASFAAEDDAFAAWLDEHGAEWAEASEDLDRVTAGATPW